MIIHHQLCSTIHNKGSKSLNTCALQDRTGQQGDTRRLSLDRFENNHNSVNFKARKMYWVPKFAKRYFKLFVLYIISLLLEWFLSFLQKRPFLLRPKVSLSVSPYCPMPYSIHFPLCAYIIFEGFYEQSYGSRYISVNEKFISP